MASSGGYDALSLLFWLFIIILSSYLLSEGSTQLSFWLGERFVGRIVLSIATTFPEIAIVGSAVNDGYFDAALGASIGSNLLMITLGLSIVALVGTTRFLSKSSVKQFSTIEFRTDSYFLAGTAVLSLILLIKGIALVSGIIFLLVFGYYAYRAYTEVEVNHIPAENHADNKPKPSKSATATFMIVGTLGVLIGSVFFVKDLANVSSGIGISLAVLSLIVSPIAGEMPEKISLILLARKGQRGLRISVANILGSKILNNTLLLGIFALLAVLRNGFSVSLVNENIEIFQLLLVTAVTILSLSIIIKSIDMRKGIVLTCFYVISIILQFVALR